MKSLPVFIALILLAACGQKHPAQHTIIKTTVDAGTDTIYSCSMHTQIIRHHPGKCPICGMTLIRVSTSKTVGPDEIQLSQRQVQLGNISFDTIRRGTLGTSLNLTGTLSFDQNKVSQISSRVMGRIERLYYKNEGEYLSEGSRLYDLYSEDLNNAKKEYILAIEKKATLGNSLVNFDQIIQSAKNKLLLWGLTQQQIKELAATRKTGLSTAFYSKVNGYITTVNAKEGEYVMEGGPVVQVADLSTIWVEAQLYSSEYDKVNKNAVADVHIAELNKTISNQRIEFVNSDINTGSRLLLLRVSLRNADGQLKPGMNVYVDIRNPGNENLSLPIDAVLRDGKNASVWIAKDRHIFKNVMVETGAEVGNLIEIKSGLTDGDIVVKTGAYLLNSEYIFKKGATPMGGMKM